MSKIVYLGYYDTENVRHISPAAVTMMDYIIECLKKSDKEFVVISPAQARNGGALSKKEVKISNNGKIIYIQSLKKPSKRAYISRAMRRITQNYYLKYELLRELKDGDQLIVYHSLALINCVEYICKKRKVSLIIQDCEIYSDVINSKKTRKKELRFLQTAEKYIFASIMLEQKINIDKKPYIVCLGTYQVESQKTSRISDGKIHIVYAGTFDPRKGGAAAAAAAAEFLNERYYVHIIGFGSETDKKLLLETIDRVSKKSTCTVTYDGLKSGEDYIRFIQSCDIGLSTQNSDAEFNATSFPSKVLSYLANGLRVVTVRIPAIETSDVNSLLCYYDDNDPQNIADAILSIDIKKSYDSRSLISRLDKAFVAEIKNMLEE